MPPAFAAIADTFVRGFTERGEVGASVCVIHAGEVVVDLVGGSADRTGNAFSNAHMLAINGAMGVPSGERDHDLGPHRPPTQCP